MLKFDLAKKKRIYRVETMIERKKKEIQSAEIVKKYYKYVSFFFFISTFLIMRFVFCIRLYLF